MESDRFHYETYPQYHSPEDFLTEGLVTENENIASLRAAAGSPSQELLENFPQNGIPFKLLPRMVKTIMFGFSASMGIDMWARQQAELTNAKLFSLEDEIDRIVSKEIMPHFPDELKNFRQEQWVAFLKNSQDFIQTQNYKQYKAEFTGFLLGHQTTPPNKIADLDLKMIWFLREFNTGNNEFDFDFAKIFELEVCTADSVVYRNRLWLERLQTTILPEIGESSFILVVGADHARVKSEKGPVGVLDFFEELVGKENVKLSTLNP